MTIKDIARESGYAISTVSRALNNHPDVSREAKEKIQAIVAAHSFRPNQSARQLKVQVTNSIAILVKGTSNMLFASIVEQMQEQIKQAGYTAVVYYLDEDSSEISQALQVCRERSALGLVFLGGNHEDFAAGFHLIQIPSVLITGSAESLQFENLSSVSTDDAAGAACALEYLVARGHSRIGIIGGNTEISHTSLLRYEGCLAALKNLGIPFDPATQYAKARFSFSSSYAATGKLLDTAPDITAIFAMSDVMAIGAIRALRDRGLRVPENISVIGYDGIDLASYYNPKLVTINQPTQSLATRGVEILVHQIQQNGPAVHETVPFSLLQGESVISYV